VSLQLQSGVSYVRRKLPDDVKQISVWMLHKWVKQKCQKILQFLKIIRAFGSVSLHLIIESPLKIVVRYIQNEYGKVNITCHNWFSYGFKSPSIKYFVRTNHREAKACKNPTLLNPIMEAPNCDDWYVLYSTVMTLFLCLIWERNLLHLFHIDPSSVLWLGWLKLPEYEVVLAPHFLIFE